MDIKELPEQIDTSTYSESSFALLFCGFYLLFISGVLSIAVSC